MEETVEDAPATEAVADGGAGDVTATQTADSGGLSNFEKALLIGLGALAIGTILDSGDEVVSNSGDRVVLKAPNGDLSVLKDDDALLRQPGSEVRTETFNDGSTRTVVTQADGTQVVTIRSANGRVLRRALVLLDGSQVELFDDTQAEQAIDVSTLPQAAPEGSVATTENELRAALQAELNPAVDRTFSLRQVRTIREVRDLAPVVELDAVTFQTGSAAIQSDQARELVLLGLAIKSVIDTRPGSVFLIKGHTDAVGDAGYNLALSDRRAETVALALTQYFDVPAANLVTQGYGESTLKVLTLESEQANRSAVVRNVTRLIQ